MGALMKEGLLIPMAFRKCAETQLIYFYFIFIYLFYCFKIAYFTDVRVVGMVAVYCVDFVHAVHIVY